MKKDIVIKVEGLSKRYSIGKREKYLTLRDRLVELPKTFFKKNKKKQDFWALKDVSFTVSRGEVMGIIGQNGAGKSTLLKLLARITEPTNGKITMRGRVASMLEVGTGFNPELTGRENIYLNGAILGMTKREIKNKFDEIVKFSGIDKFLDTPVKRYSSGMYVRLAFAVAAHLDSDILIVDEVLAVGDIGFRKKCLTKMTSFADSGKTVIFVSHNSEAIKEMCNRTIYLNSGKIKYIGSTVKALSLYRKQARQHLTNQAGEVDKFYRRGNGGVRFTEVKIINREGIEQYQFTSNEKLRLSVSYRTFTELKGLILYVGFKSEVTRENIASIYHTLTKERISANSKGKAILEVDIRHLMPKEYPIYWHLSEYAENSKNFDILDDMTQPIIITSKKIWSNAGYIHLKSKLVKSENI